MPHTNPNPDIDLQQISTRNDQARHIRGRLRGEHCRRSRTCGGTSRPRSDDTAALPAQRRAAFGRA